MAVRYFSVWWSDIFQYDGVMVHALHTYLVAWCVHIHEKSLLACWLSPCIVLKKIAWISVHTSRVWLKKFLLGYGLKILLGYGLKILPTSVSDVRRLKKLRVWFGSHLFD
jgi:hypothetical protein